VDAPRKPILQSMTNTHAGALRLEALAGAASLESNAYLLHIGTSSLLLDAGGLHSGAAWVDRLSEAPTWTWISHTHADHAGGLPALSRRFMRLPWLTSAQTHLLLPHAQGQGAAMPEPTFMPLSGARVELIRSASPDVEVDGRAMGAGHMLGAASLLLDIRVDDRFLKFFYLSDFSLHAQHGVPGAALPGADERVDVMVMEGVLAGMREEQTCAVELARLGADLAAARGPRLIAATPLCQAPQVLLGALAELTVPLHVHELMWPALDAWEAASGLKLPARRRVGLRDARALLDAGAIVLASGEHLEANSPAGLLARGIVGRADARIFVLNSLRSRELSKLAGRKIKDDELATGRVVVGRAELVRYAAPLHAPAPDLIRAVELVRPKRVLLVHGRAGDLYRLAKQIRRAAPGIKVEVMEAGGVVEL
jgi:hypothetical protein